VQIEVVEDLFQIQTNALHLTSFELYRKAPVLAAVAVFCWLVPIATVYPPSALIVELQSARISTDFNVSAFHAPDFYDTAPLSLSYITCARPEDNEPNYRPIKSFPDLMHNATFLSSCQLAEYVDLFTGAKHARVDVC
jgi:hypothetical protein